MFPLLQNRRKLLIFSRRNMHIQSAAGSRSIMSLRRSLLSPELKMFMKMLKSPSHLMFVASNVAILVHLQLYSTLRRKQKMEEFISRMDELENYVDLINDLDSQNEEIQRQITVLKKLQTNKEDISGNPDSKRTNDTPTDRSKRLGPYDQIHVEHANTFLKQRDFLASTFADKANIAKLFRGTNSPTAKEKPLVEHATYSDPILNALMALAHLLVKTFLIEVNLRNALGDEETRQIMALDSFLLHTDLLTYMNHDIDKEELLAKLYALKKKGKNEVSTNPSIIIDKNSLDELVDRFSSAEEFKNKEDKRYDLVEYLSGRWLNYDHSDTFNSIQALSPPRFGSNIVNSDEYIAKFDQIFSAYESSKAPTRKLDLILQLAKVLATGGECVPTYSVFRCLIDNFGRIGLFNYQSMVYDVVPAFEYHQTAFADSSNTDAFAPRGAFHFAHLIENDPDFLASLIEYQIQRKNMSTFKLLLDYFEPVAPATPYVLSLVPNFARMRFSGPLNLLDSDKQITIDLGTLERAVKSCVEIKEYCALDKLLNKLLLNLIKTVNGVRVILNNIKDETSLICNNTPPSLATTILFTEEILILLARAYVETADSTRANWLLPHIDTFLKTNYSPDLEILLTRMVNIPSEKRSRRSIPEETTSKRKLPVSLGPSKAYASKSLPTLSLMA